MCGIAGLLNFHDEPASPVLLKKMRAAIAHRGPDDEGYYVDGGAGLAHSRLAIIDLTPAAHQPMLTKDRRYAISYNGEIYNFQELRAELQSLGVQFHSKTDSEVVLHAYAMWGSQCVQRFNGMFAFAIWDSVDKALFLARDRYGIKPLYYIFTGHSLLFASEQKALLAHPDVARTVDFAGLMEYCTFQNFFSDKTLLQNVNLFTPGCFALVSLKKPKQALNLQRYWDFDFSESDRELSENEYLEQLDFLFQQAVTRQLVSDAPLGAYLSGGLDSGSITAIASKQYPHMKTFTCGFDLSSASGLELAFDERRQAEYLSYLFKTDHYEMVLKAGDMERVLPDLAYHLEEPRVGQSYPNFCIAHMASRFVKVVLSGAGGDELFAGYPWRYYRAASSQNFSDYIDKYYKFWQRLMPQENIQSIFAPIWNEVSQIDTREIFRNVFSASMELPKKPEDYINQSLYFEARTFLHGLLVVEDKLSMAHGLESRVPFLDNDLVDFAMRIPIKYKLKNLSEVARLNENEPGPKTTKYFEKTRDGKLIFRQLMTKYIPSQVTDGNKQGFSAPDASWFKGESIEYVRRVLFNNNAKIYNYLQPVAVQQLVQEHLEGKQNRRLLIWSLLNLECYFNHFS